jgi:hypothetical protein
MFGPKVLAARWLLLCALAFAVVGMHHLASMCHHDGEMTPVAMSSVTPTIAPVAPSDDCCGGQLTGMPMSSHDLLHLCLAILTAGLVLGVLLARWRRAGPVAGLLARLTAAQRRSPRSPPDSAAILTSLCVFRL